MISRRRVKFPYDPSGAPQNAQLARDAYDRRFGGGNAPTGFDDDDEDEDEGEGVGFNRSRGSGARGRRQQRQQLPGQKRKSSVKMIDEQEFISLDNLDEGSVPVPSQLPNARSNELGVDTTKPELAVHVLIAIGFH